MEQRLTKRNNDKLATSKPCAEQRSWIRRELTALAELMRESVTPEMLTLYAETVQDIPEHRLLIAFNRAARELRFFPRPAELRELASEYQQVPVKEWQGLSAEEKRQRDEFVGSEEGKQFMADLKAAVSNVKRFPVKSEAPPKRPIRELTDEEFERRRLELRQQSEIAKQRFGS